METGTSIQMIVGLALVVALVWKGMTVIKAVLAGEWNTVLTQVVVWVLAFLIILLVAGTEFDRVPVPIGDGKFLLDDLSGKGQLVLALLVGSTASVAFDWKKARDNNDSASEPLLAPKLNKTPSQ
ncbi:MAG TPA: hypothetical protein VLE97_07935 [Gaiellaceae bacterium]|nr:hypothetical protein [Gaiellaceae bacterium]